MKESVGIGVNIKQLEPNRNNGFSANVTSKESHFNSNVFVLRNYSKVVDSSLISALEISKETRHEWLETF